MSDIWYREYLSVASQLDTMTAERDKLREKLRAYPDDPTAVMSRSFVEDLAAHFEKLEAKLAAERERANAVCDSYALENQQFHDRFTLAEARVAKLREALEFYANPENCTPALTSRVGAFTGIARAVLEETKGDGDE
jgi:hypothetical protein